MTLWRVTPFEMDRLPSVYVAICTVALLLLGHSKGSSTACVARSK